MTIEARYNLQKGIAENRHFPAIDYTSDGSLIDEYILAKVQMRNNSGNRILLDPIAYNAVVDQAALDIAKRVESLFQKGI